MDIKEDFDHREQSMALSDADVGDIVRWMDHGYDYALKMNGFFMVTDVVPKDSSSVALINLSDGRRFNEGGKQRVIVHKAKLVVERNLK